MKRIIILIVLTILVSCKTHKTSLEYVKLDSLTTFNSKVIHDSIFVYKRDSIVVRMSGDTMFVDRWHTDYRDILKVRVDTFYKDKISYSVIRKNTIEYIEKDLKWWQKMFIWIGIISILLGILIIYIKIFIRR